MNEISVINETETDVDLELLKKVALYTLEYEKVDNGQASIIIVDNTRIKKINKEYRNVDRETDVISFALEDNMDVKYTDFRLLGDIYISIDKARSQALEYGHSFKRELYFLAVHGFLHLLGYDHMKKEDEDVMFKKQEEVLSRYGIER